MRIPRTIEEIVLAMIEKNNAFFANRDEEEISVYWEEEDELDFELSPERRYKRRKEWLK